MYVSSYWHIRVRMLLWGGVAGSQVTRFTSTRRWCRGGGASKKRCSTCCTSTKVPILTLGAVAGGVAGVAGGLEKEMLKAAKEMQRALHF